METELDYFLEFTLSTNTLITGSTNFWNGSLIVVALLGDWERSTVEQSKVRNLLDFLKNEYLRWVDSSNSSVDDMFRDATILASQMKRPITFKRLLEYQFHTYEKLSGLLVGIVQNGPIRRHVIRNIITHKIQGEPSPLAEWQLLFVLLECYPSIQSQLLTSKISFEQATPPMLRMILITILVVDPRPNATIRYFEERKDLGSRRSLCPQPVDWSPITFATEEVCNRVEKLVGRGLYQEVENVLNLAALFQQLHEDAWTLIHKQIFGEGLSFLLEPGHPQSAVAFSAEAFESDGYPCLQWAIERAALVVVKALVPHYAPLIRDLKKNRLMISLITYSAKDASIDILAALVLLMPHKIFQRIVRELEHHSERTSSFIQLRAGPKTQFTSEQRQKWLALMGRDHPSDVPAMEWLATAWKGEDELSQVEWEVIVRFGFRKWRESVGIF